MASVGSGTQPRKGVVIAYDRRFSSEFFAQAAAEVLLAYDIPVPWLASGAADADDLVRGGRARCGVRNHDHRLAQPVDGQRLQGQVATRRRGRPGHAGASSRRPSATTPDALPTQAVRRCARRGQGRAASTRIEGYVEYIAALAGPRLAEGRGHARARRADVGLRRRLDPAAAGRRQDPGHRDPPGAQPVVRRRQPGAHRPEHRRGAGHPRRRRLRPRAAARRRRGSRRRGRREGHVHPPARR